MDSTKIMAGKPHRHATMIKAKADNMELVVFLNIGPEWVESRLDTMVANQDMDFFLCLPKHNDNGQCLHWLNGGDVEFRRDGESWQDECEEYHGWASYCGMMNCDVEFRIKPRKERRWICITNDLEIEDGTLYESYADADENSPGYKQIVEIEIEV